MTGMPWLWRNYEVGDEVEIDARHTLAQRFVRGHITKCHPGGAYTVIHNHSPKIGYSWSAPFLRKVSILELIAEAATE